MSEPRKHHYVPICYQRNFTNASGLLWVYDREVRHYKELHPKSICLVKDLYAFDREEGQKDQRVESFALATVDGLFATALREFAPERFPSFLAFQATAYFMGVQYSRLPSYARFISAMYKKGVEETMRLTTVNVNRMKHAIEQYTRKTGKTVNASPESMIEAVRGNKVEVVITKLPFIRHLFRTAAVVTEVAQTLSWEILWLALSQASSYATTLSLLSRQEVSSM